MKYFKRLGIYKASNVTFNPKTISAYSYGWWNFVTRIDGVVLFNNYTYSNSTSKHQRKIQQLMHDLGIKIDIFVESYKGFQNGETCYIECIKNAYRDQNIELAEKLQKLFKIKFTQSRIQEIYTDLEEELCDAFLSRSIRRQERKERQHLLSQLNATTRKETPNLFLVAT